MNEDRSNTVGNPTPSNTPVAGFAQKLEQHRRIEKSLLWKELAVFTAIVLLIMIRQYLLYGHFDFFHGLL